MPDSILKASKLGAVRINLDHIAATPVHPRALQAMHPFLRTIYGDPGSLHTEGILARDALHQARTKIAQTLRAAAPEEIIFAASGTEAINLAIQGSTHAHLPRRGEILYTATDQPSVTATVSFLAESGFRSKAISVGRAGRVNLDHLKESISSDTILICTHLANHDLGTIQPVSEIVALAAERSVPVLLDGSAAAGWLPMDVDQLGVNLLALSPRLLGAPPGAGILYRRSGTRLKPLLHGKTQEHGLRAGFENLAAIVAAVEMVEFRQNQVEVASARLRKLQINLWHEIHEKLPEAKLNGPAPGPDRLPNNLNFSLSGIDGEALGLMLDVRGFAIGSSTPCVRKDEKIPPVLRAIGLDELAARGTIRLTLGHETNQPELDQFTSLLPRLVKQLREL